MVNNNNPIKYSDLINDDGAIERLIDQLKEMGKQYAVTVAGMREEAQRLADSLKDVSGATEDGREKTKKAATDAERLAKAQRDLEAAQSDSAQKLAELNLARQEANRIAKLTAKVNKSQEGSYNKLSAEYSLLKIRYDAMSEAERKNTKEGQELVARTKAIYDEMKRLQEATGKYTLDVGHYGRAIDELHTSLANMNGVTGTVVGGFDKMGVAANKFIAHPIVAIFVALFTIVDKLWGAFKKTETGINFVNKAGAVMSAGMNVLVDISKSVYDYFARAFQDPIGWIKDLGRAIWENLISRFQAFPKLGQAVYNTLKAVFTLDGDALTQSLKDAGNAMTQFVTGATVQQIGRLKDELRNLTTEVKAQVDAFSRLEEAKRKALQTNRGLEKSIADLSKEEERQKAIADDATRGFAERDAAANKAAELTEKRTKIEVNIAKERLRLINEEVSLKRRAGQVDDELLDKQKDAYISLRSAESQYILSRLDSEKRLSEIKQDLLEKDLDILLDGFDNQKTVNLSKVSDDRRTYEERKKIIEDTRKLADASFKQQIKTIAKFTDKSINSSELIQEEDAVALNAKIRNLGLSEIIEGRLLEIVRDRKSLIQDLIIAEKGLDEAQQKEADNAVKAQKKVAAETEKRKEEAKKEKPQDIYEALGLDLPDEKKEAINTSVQYAVDALQRITDAKVAAADRAVEKSREEVEFAQNSLQMELDARNAGYANNVALARKELDEARRNQEKAAKMQQRAQRQQEAVQSLQQMGNLVTASALIWAQLGFPWALPAIGTMWTSFAASKIKAAQVTRSVDEKYGEGTVELLEGGSHQSGNDIDLGRKKDGTRRRAEGGEFFAVINKRNSKRYRQLIPDVINSLNNGTFFQRYAQANKPGELALNVSGGNPDLRGIIRDVRAIREQNERRIYQDASGATVEEYKNLIRRIR